MALLKTKRNGVKIATTLIFEEIEAQANPHFIMGMIYFAKRFGAITGAEQSALIQHLNENRIAQNRKE